MKNKEPLINSVYRGMTVRLRSYNRPTKIKNKCAHNVIFLEVDNIWVCGDCGQIVTDLTGYKDS